MIVVYRSTSSVMPRDDMLLVQTIQITDKFGFDRQKAANRTTSTVFIEEDVHRAGGPCLNAGGIALAGIAFLLAQAAAAAVWALAKKRGRARAKARDLNRGVLGIHDTSSSSSSIPVTSRASDSMCKLYDANFGARSHHRHF